MNQVEIDSAALKIVSDLNISDVGIAVYSRKPRRILSVRSYGKNFYPGTDEYRRAFSRYYLSQGTRVLLDEDKYAAVPVEDKRISIENENPLNRDVLLVQAEDEISKGIDEVIYPPMETSALISMKRQDKNRSKPEKDIIASIKEQNEEYLMKFISGVDTEENRSKSDQELIYMESANIINRDGFYDFIVPPDQQDNTSRRRLSFKAVGAVTGLVAASGVCIYFILSTLSGFSLI